MPGRRHFSTRVGFGAAVIAPALATALGAAFGTSGWGLAALACGAGFAAAALAWGLLSDRRAGPEVERALIALSEAAGIDAPRIGTDTDLARWATGAAARTGAQRSAAAINRAIFDATDAPVFATSASGSILLCNRAACEFLERAPREIVGRELGDFFSQSELLAAHGAARAGGMQRAQVRISREGVARTYQVFAAAAEVRGAAGIGVDAPGAVVVVTLRDVTELALAVQLKTDFVANASHELRTPLASIRGAVETLRDLGEEDAEMRARLVRMIAGNAERLEDLTRDLLDLSRLESPDAPAEVGPVDLAELARAVAGLLEGSAARKRVSIEAEIAPAAAHLRSDPRLLRVILRNLAENAVKFAYEGTTVRIVAGAVEGEGGGGMLRVRVIDRGIGIPLAQQARIFERFFQGDPARAGDAQVRGTGLGLAIVKHAVRTLGGTIAVESVWKEGTTMTVELPGCVAVDGAQG